jgi:hypothetical protein
MVRWPRGAGAMTGRGEGYARWPIQARTALCFRRIQGRPLGRMGLGAVESPPCVWTWNVELGSGPPDAVEKIKKSVEVNMQVEIERDRKVRVLLRTGSGDGGPGSSRGLALAVGCTGARAALWARRPGNGMDALWRLGTPMRRG